MAALSPSVPVGIIGAGTMGAGMAQVAATAGHPVWLFDQQPEAIDRGISRIASGLERQVARGRMNEADSQALLGRIRPAESLDDLANCGLVIEAIVENLEVKQGLFRQLEAICPGKCILASNTSSLSITAIGAALQRPERLLGMHFFNPAPVMKLVEVIRGLQSSPEHADTLLETARAWGKRPVLARSTPGFIVNRVARPFYAEGLRLIEEGACDPATLDAIMRESGGFRMGPCELTDLIGQDVNYAVTCSVYDAFYQDPRFLPSLVQKELVDGGLLGRKSGRGFYDHSDQAEQPQPMTLAEGKAPQRIRIHGDTSASAPLIDAWRGSGMELEMVGGETLSIEGDGFRLAPSDGRSATQRAADQGIDNLVLFDLALNYGSAARIAIACNDGCAPRALEQATGLFQSAGKAVSRIDDTPGMAVLRTVCMLANEAADAVLQQVCDAAAADDAMCYGVNYPLGPLAWAERIGLPRVLRVLENLQQAYGLDRYRPSLLLQRKVAAGGRFHQVNGAE